MGFSVFFIVFILRRDFLGTRNKGEKKAITQNVFFNGDDIRNIRFRKMYNSSNEIF